MEKGKWTQFMDMHSGGGQKLNWSRIYIEAPEDEAKIIFYNRFGRNPERVTCTCCGEDYSISESESLKDATAFERNCDWISNNKEKGGGHYIDRPSKGWGMNYYETLDKYIKRKEILVIYKKDIKPKERKGDIPEEGYIWVN